MMLLRGPWPRRPRLPPTPRPAGRVHPPPRTPTSQVLCVKLCGNLKYSQSHLYSTVVPPDEITINYRHGLPLITLTLPSRKERCQFVVKPMLSTVGSFLRDLQNEDKGVKTAAILTTDGREIPATTLMEILLMNDFKLVINKITYDVQCPKKEKLSMEHATDMENVKSLVHRLFTALHLEEFQKKREHHLLEKIDHLRGQLQPLEQIKAGIEARSEAKTSGLLWAGLALLSVQGGALAWLTWWVYSWDIMEPVTYFITFANSMVFFAYFIVTRQDYTYSAVKSRQFLHFFHKKSKQQHFDVVQYNKLKEDLAKATESLKQVFFEVLSGDFWFVDSHDLSRINAGRSLDAPIRVRAAATVVRRTQNQIQLPKVNFQKTQAREVPTAAQPASQGLNGPTPGKKEPSGGQRRSGHAPAPGAATPGGPEAAATPHGVPGWFSGPEGI
ncbi:calcium uniporter regulatory subunit MCUb, mitochondrial [Puma concolor]|uniref:Calcium uniporter protein n=1 Tax=Puma concolor TaxID=9696 RepID=A0A6P6HQM1_PUMCO|nr:calcium uniporter regulatory subunit MCUb, mitochondrial [Puma concolor]